MTLGMGNLISRYSLIAAVIGMLMLPQASGAQQGPPDIPPDLFGASGPDSNTPIGVIAGTDMLRDEFRARALIQLKAIALNALAYRLANEDEYPQSLHQLERSPSWNLDVENMFTGNRIRQILFEPDKNDMTTGVVLDLPLDIDENVANMGLLMPPGGGGSGAGGAAGSGGDTGSGGDAGTGGDSGAAGGNGNTGPVIQPVAPATPPRIDPRKVRAFTGGNVLYFVSGDMLQLVLYAPDGTYMEFVDVTPNGHWRRQLNTAGCPFWPDSIGAAEVLFFAGMVPQHHNLVEFMGNRETVPEAKFAQLSAAELLQMALDLDITVLNPITHAPASSQPEFSLGDYCATDPASPAPLSLYMNDKQAWTLEMLTAAAREAANGEPSAEQSKPKPPGHPPLGGRS